jgi:hypothetical protein
MAIIAALVSSDKFKLGAIITGWLGLPVWMLIAFHSLVLALVFAHGLSVRILEYRLVSLADVSDYRGAIGAATGTGVTDVDILLKKPKRWGLVGSTFIAYGGFFSISIVFTFYALRQSWEHQTTTVGYWGGVWIPLIVYAICILVELFAVAYIFVWMRNDLLDSKVDDVSIPSPSATQHSAPQGAAVTSSPPTGCH